MLDYEELQNIYKYQIIPRRRLKELRQNSLATRNFNENQYSFDFWYDASDASTITTSGGKVTAMTDKSGNSINLAEAGVGVGPAYGSRTLNGINILDCNATDAWLSRSGSPMATMFTGGGYLAAVIDIDSDGEGDLGAFLRADGTPGTGGWLTQTTSESGSNVNVQLTRLFTTTNGTWNVTTTLGPHLVEFDYDDSSTSNDPIISIDGVPQPITESLTPAGTAESATAGDFQVGNNNNIRNFDGGIAEIIGMSGNPSGIQKRRLQKHLLQKWGL